MKVLFRLWAGLLLFIFFVSCGSDEKAVSGEALESGFVNPHDSIQTSVYWYWISDNISKEGVEKDLESMKAAGINRAFIGYIGQDDVPSGNVKIFSDEWWEILHVALKKATELNIEIGIFNSPGWSQSGGPWVQPDETMRYLATSELHVKGPQKLSQKLDKPVEPFQDVKVIAYPEPKFYGQIFDSETGRMTSLPNVTGLSKLIDQNAATGMTPTGVTNAPASPEATGLEIDKMSKKHVEKHFEEYIGEILKRIPEADRKTFKVVVQDSYETGGQNFTDDFLAEFKERYRYDPLPFLPVFRGFVVNSQLESDRFLWDVRRMVADKVAYDYIGGLRDISHKYGLKTWLECYGHWGFPGEFLMYGGQSDEIGGEFWSEGELGNIENRAATSCGHIYGKTKISAESNTVAGGSFSRYPAMFKQRTDRFFAEGINNTLLHVYISQPYEDRNPGVNAWFGNEFNRKNTWYPQLSVFVDYLKRSNYMLQQGLNVADVAYFIGEDAPKMTGVTDPELPAGYQFDYMNAEVIEKFMTVKDGLITLPHGTQYRILVLPKLETMRPELLAKIKQLVHDGAVMLGPAPKRSPSQQNQPEADQQVAELAAELWGDVDGASVKSRKVGKGLIMHGLSMEEAFVMINCVPDCKIPEDNSIHFGHRTMNGAEIYFISNQTNETKQVTPEFRVKDRQPEFWDATIGTIRVLPAYEQTENTTAVPLKLAPYQSAFIVFRKQAGPAKVHGVEANYPEPIRITDLKGPWTLQFDAAQRGPEQPVVFDTLEDWSTSDDERIKYYSGTAVYTNKFNLDELPEGEQIIIGLGNLTAMAKVTVNDQYAGGVWTPPYQLDITNFVKSGKNELKIDVINTWVNQLIGDQQLPADQRLTWCPVNPYGAGSPLQPSGLFGPVTVSGVKY